MDERDDRYIYVYMYIFLSSCVLLDMREVLENLNHSLTHLKKKNRL